MKIISGIHAGREVELVSALDAVVTVRFVSGPVRMPFPVEPTDLDMSPEEWGVLSNLGGTENLTRWYGYDIATEKVVEVIPHG